MFLKNDIQFLFPSSPSRKRNINKSGTMNKILACAVYFYHFHLVAKLIDPNYFQTFFYVKIKTVFIFPLPWPTMAKLW